MMLGIAAAVALVLSAPEPDLQQRIDRAEVAVGEGRWLDAAADYEVVFNETGDLRVRYAQAEALRLGGRCADALPLYEAYLEGQPSRAMQTRTAQLIRVCEDEVAAEEARRAALETKPPPPTEAAPPLAEGPRDMPPRWYQDPAGDALAALGVTGIVAGSVVLSLGVREGDAADQAADDRAFGRAIDRAETRTLAGGVTLGVGAALLVGGVVRWVLVDRSYRREFEVLASPSGIALRGRIPSIIGTVR